ncbi:hypothetical protein [Elioraea thermophila]|uniref:hypothetical protein n=1 Tax=Elioraea thermophila TaxID=2185104 RepID=UPI000DF3B65E|nr:hypothetical protein [Elioraea thermophila]
MIRLLLLGLVLAGVWYLYRMVTKQGPAAPTLGQSAGTAAAVEGEKAEAASEPGEEAEEMQECPVCRAYLPSSATDGCGRPDCPIPALAAARASEPRGGTAA